jgi:uncharacterized membrane protein HdeD (DUF308 family)
MTVRVIMNYKDMGFIALGILLVLEGLIALFSLSFGGLNIIMGILALVAGILLLLGPVMASTTRNP